MMEEIQGDPIWEGMKPNRKRVHRIPEQGAVVQ
jgi:hypothetical protein